MECVPEHDAMFGFGPMHKWASVIKQGDNEHFVISLIPVKLVHDSSSSVHICCQTLQSCRRAGCDNSFSATAVQISERLSESPPSGDS